MTFALSQPAVRALAIVAFAVLVGPLVAGLSVFALMLVATAFETGMPIWGSGDFIVVMSAAYHMGWPVALVTGLLVALWSCTRRVTWRVVIAATVAANAVFVTLVQGYEFMVGQSAIPYEEFVLVLLASLWAALLCWFLSNAILWPFRHRNGTTGVPA